MIVSISGYGNSGASAVLDYFKGFSYVSIFDKCELEMIHECDGINDLRYHIVNSKDRIACNAAFHRFYRLQKYGVTGKTLYKLLGKQFEELYKAYIDELCLIKWNGESSFFDPIDISHFSRKHVIYMIQVTLNELIKRINPRWAVPKRRERFYSILDDNDFIHITKNYLKHLFEMLGFQENQITFVDMLFSVTNPNQGMEFFDKAKTISVNRDPRDLYVTVKQFQSMSRFIPNEDVTSFVSYYRSVAENNTGNDDVLIVKYEDLIYKYFETTQLLNSFVGISTRPDSEFQFFDPLVSVKYTNRKHLYEKCLGDINYIEKELGQYIYDFERATSPEDDEYLLSRERNGMYQGYKESSWA